MNFLEYERRYPDFVGTLQQLRARRDRKLRRIVPELSERAIGTCRIRFHDFFDDVDVRTIYLYESALKKKQLGRYSPTVLARAAENFSLTAPIHESVRREDLRERFRRRAREVYKFGPKRHAAQCMVADLLGASHALRPDQFTIRGGVPAALQAVEEAFRNGFRYAVERDITRYYENINPEGLYGTLRPLSREVIDNVVLSSRAVITPHEADNRPSSFTQVRRLGPLPSRGSLLPGAASSPIVAELVMKGLLDDVTRGRDIRCVAYADNVLLMARTMDEADEASRHLEILAGECSCGPLELKPPNHFDLASIDGYIRFLGYDGIVSGNDSHPIEWQPEQSAIDTCIHYIEHDGRRTSSPGQIVSWLESWRRGYSAWHDGDFETIRFKVGVLTRAAFSARPAAKRDGYIATICSEIFALRERPSLYRTVQDFLPGGENQNERRVIDQILGFAQVTEEWQRIQDQIRSDGLALLPDRE